MYPSCSSLLHKCGALIAAQFDYPLLCPSTIDQRVNCHIIFDFMMEYFRRKARLVEGGHVTEPP